MKPVSVFIIEPSKLVRDAFCHLLSERGFETLLCVSSLPEADLELERRTPDLILMSVNAVRTHVQWLCMLSRPSMKLVILAEHLTEQDIAVGTQANVAGYLSVGASAEGLIHCLLAVLADEIVISGKLLRGIHRSDPVNLDVDHVAISEHMNVSNETNNTIGDHDFFNAQVLAMIMNGKSLRSIASSLGISEDAAMGQLKAMMRQIGVRTKMQAALWIARSGILPSCARNDAVDFPIPDIPDNYWNEFPPAKHTSSAANRRIADETSKFHCTPVGQID